MPIALLPNPIMKKDSVESILARAKQRAEAMNLPYAGALLPLEAQALMQNDPEAKLVDVRTQAEWDYVGHILVPLRSALAPRGSSGNPSRLPQLLQRARGIRRREGSARPSRYCRRLAICRLTLGPRLTYDTGSIGSPLGYPADQLTTPE